MTRDSVITRGAPGCAVMSHEEHHRTNIFCHHHRHGMAYGGRGIRHKLGHYLELWVMVIAECNKAVSVTGLTNPIVLSICLSD